MCKIEFMYKDEISRGEWRHQECICSSVKECIEIYGLEDDPSIYAWRILSVDYID